MVLRSVSISVVLFSALCSGVMADSLTDSLKVQSDRAADQGNSTTVTYGDLDISRSQGAKVVLGRVQEAARVVCGPEPSSTDLVRVPTYRACLTTAVSGAVTALNEPTVSSLYAQRNPEFAQTTPTGTRQTVALAPAASSEGNTAAILKQ